MSNEGRERENGYRAFISYSHRDDAAAKSLHKRLETYRLPKKLIGQSGERGPITERLTPIFRDLDELSAADDLTVEIKAALARSATLIVLCSPGAKASKWVNLEIETFRALHGNSRPVLAALIEGEPADAFPPALIADGQEPVAADFRKNRDGKRLALLKLVAGMAGAPLDALVQRDAQRQYRRVMAITGTALTAALAMALLLVVALRAQSEAERQRQEAEGLVEYMLTDLRDKLRGVGRIDVSETVNERAMKYYNGQGDLNDLPAESLERRARVLHAMGEDFEKKGGLAQAHQKFNEAHRTTGVLLAKAPDNADRIFAHAQSEYWLGFILQKFSKYREALVRYQNYLKLAERGAGLPLPRPDAGKEVGWAESAVGIIYLSGLNEPQLARKHFDRYRIAFEKIASEAPDDADATYSLSDAHAWTADCYAAEKNWNRARQHRELQIALIDRLLTSDSANDRWALAKVASQRSLFRACLGAKDFSCAKKSINLAERLLNERRFDESSLAWQWQSAFVELDTGFLAQRSGDHATARRQSAKVRRLIAVNGRLFNEQPDKLRDIRNTLAILDKNILIKE